MRAFKHLLDRFPSYTRAHHHLQLVLGHETTWSSGLGAGSTDSTSVSSEDEANGVRQFEQACRDVAQLACTPNAGARNPLWHLE
jgi:hypothetical protein